MKKKLLLLACLGLMVSCSVKKDSAKNRAFHNSTAWFNTLFNAEEEMDKKIDELEISYKDNYSEILPVDPRPEIVQPELSEDYIDQMSAGFKNKTGGSSSKDAPQVTGFDLVEKKALKAIENHSMLIDGRERNKTMTRAYLVLGKARYNNGKSFEALEALNYMQNKLPYNKKFTPEARLYTALANFQTGNYFEGERILENLNKDDGYKKKYQEKFAKYYAENMIRNGDYEEAIELLDKTIENTKNKKRKARYYFIEGQLYSLLGMQNEAGEAFTRVYKMKPGFEMEVKSQLGIAANFDPEKNSYNSYKEHLLDVSKKGNYVSRKNEFFYAIGDMAIKEGKVEEARKYLKESFVGPASDPYVRGRAYERYADLEFDQGNYVHASAYYDSALSVTPYDKDIARITERSTSLKFLMEKYYLVKRNDSILKLAYMTQEEKDKFFGDYIAKLKIEDAKRQKQIEEEATIFQTQTKGGGSFGGSFEGGGSTFYFYNTSLKSNGVNEFKRIWGNVRLGDNWRSSTGGALSIEDQEAEMLGQADAQNPRRYELDFYLEQIPTKQNELNKLKIERDTTELSLGIGYYDLFKNAKSATETLEHLVSTPPKEQATEAQAYYQIYRINQKEENLAKADEYKNLILSKYPNSIYAEYILNPEVNFITPTTKEALAYYEETYDLYKAGKYDEVKSRTVEAVEKYPTEAIIAKFSLVNALAIGKTEGRENFVSALELITVAYQNSDEAKKAQEILDLLNGVTKKEQETEGEESNKNPETKREGDAKQRPGQGNVRGNNPNSNPNSNPNQSGTSPTRPQKKEDGSVQNGPGTPGDADDD
ncbi:type IX secretion system periplasmic lipoprotein PorW/SprE [Moheibacter lacus]|uniref:Tetratricopeptide repeat protein n=1 Tax=Moheibacter lacus TaxID=2745851 RepID=A0A838ZT18_9FLAO|nr:tetratricopeptide repeat protein [Moheibacter lacus]MBA5630126.1 tetratricopeptide repeat protein [Moheibacter lacus]